MVENISSAVAILLIIGCFFCGLSINIKSKNVRSAFGILFILVIAIAKIINE